MQKLEDKEYGIKPKGKFVLPNQTDLHMIAKYNLKLRLQISLKIKILNGR